MFFPFVPEVGVDIDKIELVSSSENSVTEIQMTSELKFFATYLSAGNDVWGRWIAKHPEDRGKYQSWFKKASHLSGRVIPSMVFDFSYMPADHVQARFEMIKTVVHELGSQVPRNVKKASAPIGQETTWW